MFDETGIFEDPQLELSDASALTHGSVHASRHTRLNLGHPLKGTTGATADLLQTPCSSYINPGSEAKSSDVGGASVIVDSGYCNSIGSSRSKTGDSVLYKHSFDSQRKEFVSRDETESRDEDKSIFPSPKVRLLSAFDELPSSSERKIAGTKFSASHARFSRTTRSGHRRSLDSYFNFDVDSKPTSYASRQLSSAHIDLSNLDSVVSGVPTPLSFSIHRQEHGTFVRRHSVSDVLYCNLNADELLHSTPVITPLPSRRNIQPIPAHIFYSKSNSKFKVNTQTVDSETTSFNTYDPSLDSIIAVAGSDARYRVRDREADSKLCALASSPSSNECNLTVDQQKELESVLLIVAPAVRDRLIGRKMGLDYVDFIQELHIRSMTGVLKNVLGKVNVIDLVQMRSISESWMAAVDNDVASQQRIKLWRTKVTTSPSHKSATKENNDGCRKDAKNNLMTGTSQPLSRIQSRSTVSKTPTKKDNSKVDLFLQEASKLKTGELQTKCSRCQRPARLDTTQERARCTSELCRFDYCTKCLRDFHGSERCDVGQNFRYDLRIGSKQSRKNLRRLL